MNGSFRFFLVGVVIGNPSGCDLKTLPDVYNFIGNKEVSLYVYRMYTNWKYLAIYTLHILRIILDSGMDK